MKISHLQSSTQIIDLGGVRLLTDPWLTEGEYYGSWYHYPPFEPSAISDLQYDYIYVSHIHPDHLSEKTFRRLPARVPVIIQKFASSFLKRKIEQLGFEVVELDHGRCLELADGVSITIFAADNCNPEICAKFMGCTPAELKFGATNIDTLALFKGRHGSILNTNDCPFAMASETIRRNDLHHLGIDVLLVGYAGAGPFPQCFRFDDSEALEKAANRKKRQFLDNAVRYVDLIAPMAYVPFAGTYTLGSRLSGLNRYRGVPTLTEAIDYIDARKSSDAKGRLMNQGDELQIPNLQLTTSRSQRGTTFEEYVRKISKRQLDYDGDNWDDAELDQLIARSYDRFSAKARQIGYSSSTKIIVSTDKTRFVFSAECPPTMAADAVTKAAGTAFVEITLDHNLLNRLLRGPRYSHWNNAEIGSHLTYYRKPDIFERALYHCMCFFHA
jgi:UDP-MurNAc hydroxylase